MPKQASAPKAPKSPSPSDRNVKGVLIKKASARGAASVGATSSKAKPLTSTIQVQAANAHLTDVDMQARIAQRAYELFHRRGGHHGQDLEDWLKAEQEVLAEEPT
jgi:hypothetical protein